MPSISSIRAYKVCRLRLRLRLHAPHTWKSIAARARDTWRSGLDINMDTGSTAIYVQLNKPIPDLIYSIYVIADLQGTSRLETAILND